MAKKNEKQDEILSVFAEAKEEIIGEQLDLLTSIDEQDDVQDTEKTPVAVEEQEAHEFRNAAEEEKYYTGSDGTEYSEEEWNAPVIRNGPSRKEIEGWKSRYEHIYFTPFDDATFVWRTLNRPEYREIIRDNTLTALDREEFFTEKCVLFPYDFSLDKIKKSRAGIASLLSEMIMDKSGFVAQSAPIKL